MKQTKNVVDGGVCKCVPHGCVCTGDQDWREVYGTVTQGDEEELLSGEADHTYLNPFTLYRLSVCQTYRL